jgi:hypothetical protein
MKCVYINKATMCVCGMGSMALMEQVAMYFVALPCPPMPILAASDDEVMRAKLNARYRGAVAKHQRGD